MEKRKMSAAEEAAFRGEDMPTGLDWRGVAEYCAMSALYSLYRSGNISREKATELKDLLMCALDGAEGSYRFGIRCWESAAERHRKIETALSQYRVHPCKETADALATACDGACGILREWEEQQN